MSSVKQVSPVKLIMGIIYPRPQPYPTEVGEEQGMARVTATMRGGVYRVDRVKDEIERELNNLYGEIDFCSEVIPFNFTDYYENEFGKDLLRCWLSFDRLIYPDEIADIKLATNRLEFETSVDNKRQINIDPGYISTGKLVLVSTKDSPHRIYLKEGIFAEVTLLYQNKDFKVLDWTYPDYRLEIAKQFFITVRKKYLTQIAKHREKVMGE